MQEVFEREGVRLSGDAPPLRAKREKRPSSLQALRKRAVRFCLLRPGEDRISRDSILKKRVCTTRKRASRSMISYGPRPGTFMRRVMSLAVTNSPILRDGKRSKLFAMPFFQEVVLD